MRFAFGLLASLAMVAVPATAADTGFYLGGTVGQGSYDINKGDIDRDISDIFGLLDTDYEFTSDLDDSDTAFGLVVGYRFLPYLAAELAYLDFGEAEYKASGDLTFLPDGPTVPTDVSLKWSGTGVALSGLGLWPINDQWDVFARLGLVFASTDLDLSINIDGEPGSDSGSKSSTEFLWGVGGQFNFLDHWTGRLEYMQVPDLGDEDETGEADTDLFMLSILYRF